MPHFSGPLLGSIYAIPVHQSMLFRCQERPAIGGFEIRSWILPKPFPQDRKSVVVPARKKHDANHLLRQRNKELIRPSTCPDNSTLILSIREVVEKLIKCQKAFIRVFVLAYHAVCRYDPAILKMDLTSIPIRFCTIR